MKKQYQKPQVSFESFGLSDTIAGSCAGSVTAQSSACDSYATWSDPKYGVCNFYIKDADGFSIAMFLDGGNNCMLTPGQFGGNQEICYQVPTADNLLFRS